LLESTPAGCCFQDISCLFVGINGKSKIFFYADYGNFGSWLEENVIEPVPIDVYTIGILVVQEILIRCGGSGNSLSSSIIAGVRINTAG
jgi:hypothetical protein